MKTRTRSRQRGFTLLEMLVVMVLMGLITSLALPAMQRWHDSVQLRTQAGLVVDTLRAAAFEASATRRNLLLDASSFHQAASVRPPSSSASEPAESEAASAASLAASTPLSRTHVSVDLARGWVVSEVAPARFLANGLCLSGGFKLRPPTGSEIPVRISGPVCAVELVDASKQP